MYDHTRRCQINEYIISLTVHRTHHRPTHYKYWGPKLPVLHDRVVVLQQDQMDHVKPCDTALELFYTYSYWKEVDKGSIVV